MLLLHVLIVPAFLKEYLDLNPGLLFWQSAIKSLLVISVESVVLDFERIQFFEWFFAILLNFILEFNAFPVEIIRRVFLSLRCHPRCLIRRFLGLCLFYLFLLLFLLPFLVDLATLGRVFLIDRLQFLLYFGEQAIFSLIINGFLIAHFLRLDYLALIITYRRVNHSRVLLTRLLLSFLFLLFKLVFHEPDDGVLVFHIEIVFPQKLLNRNRKVSLFGDLYLVTLAADV